MAAGCQTCGRSSEASLTGILPAGGDYWLHGSSPSDSTPSSAGAPSRAWVSGRSPRWTRCACGGHTSTGPGSGTLTETVSQRTKERRGRGSAEVRGWTRALQRERRPGECLDFQGHGHSLLPDTATGRHSAGRCDAWTAALLGEGAVADRCGTSRPPRDAASAQQAGPSEPAAPARAGDVASPGTPACQEWEIDGTGDDRRQVWLWGTRYIPYERLTLASTPPAMRSGSG